MEDGDTESENASRVIQDFVFLCRKIGSINGYFCRYIIKAFYQFVAYAYHLNCIFINIYENIKNVIQYGGIPTKLIISHLSCCLS